MARENPSNTANEIAQIKKKAEKCADDLSAERSENGRLKGRIEELEEKANSMPRPLRWMRSVGFGSTLLGGAGLMGDFFQWSVSFVYAGLLVLILDLFFEKLGKFWKLAGIAIIAAIVVAFTRGVVMHPDPVDYYSTLRPDGSVELTIYNGSQETDYSAFDIKIVTEPRVFIQKVVEGSGMSGVDIIDLSLKSGWDFHTGDGMRTEFKADGTPEALFNFQRVRFSLPHETTVVFKIFPEKGEMSPRSVRFSGTFKGKFQTHHVDYESNLVPRPWGIYETHPH